MPRANLTYEDFCVLHFILKIQFQKIVKNRLLYLHRESQADQKLEILLICRVTFWCYYDELSNPQSINHEKLLGDQLSHTLPQSRAARLVRLFRKYISGLSISHSSFSEHFRGQFYNQTITIPYLDNFNWLSIRSSFSACNQVLTRQIVLNQWAD